MRLAENRDHDGCDNENEEEEDNILRVSNDMTFNNKEKQVNDSEAKPSYWTRYRWFLDAPKVHFVYESLIFLFFLIFFNIFISESSK